MSSIRKCFKQASKTKQNKTKQKNAASVMLTELSLRLQSCVDRSDYPK